MLGVNLLSWFTIPKNLRRFFHLKDCVNLIGIREMPFPSIMCPRKLSCLL